MECVKCGATNNLTKDHIIPKWIYKRFTLAFKLQGFKKNLGKQNIQILCEKCNGNKSGKLDMSNPLARDFAIKLRDSLNELLNEPTNV